jgi:histidinol-phosphate/aromatic aminotransferase/cobyric acid decarboxylase-like protein
MYEKISRVLGLKFKNVPLKNDFSLDISLMLKKIAELNPAIIFLSLSKQPNW